MVAQAFLPVRTGKNACATKNPAPAPSRVKRVAPFAPRGQTPHSDSFQIKQQHCEVGGGDAADAARLTYAGGANAVQLFARLDAQLRYRSKVECRRNPLVFQALEA